MDNQQVSILTAIPDFDGYFFSADGEIYSKREVWLHDKTSETIETTADAGRE